MHGTFVCVTVDCHDFEMLGRLSLNYINTVINKRAHIISVGVINNELSHWLLPLYIYASNGRLKTK